jgi:hypothetical protein
LIEVLGSAKTRKYHSDRAQRSSERSKSLPPAKTQ